MANYDKRNYAVAVTGLLVAIASVGLSALAIHATWDVAERAGSFDKPLLTLGIGGIRLPSTLSTSVLVGAPSLSGSGNVVIGAIPFSLADEGQKTILAATLTVRYHEVLKRKTLEALKLVKSGPFNATDVDVSLTSGPPFDYVSYRVKALDPGMGLSVQEPLRLTETRIKSSVPITTKDHVKGTVDIDMSYAIKILATTSGNDVGVANYPIELTATTASSIDELIRFANDVHVQREREAVRRELGFLSYFAGLVLAREKRQLVVIQLELDSHHTKEGVLLFARPTPQVRKLIYDIFVWNQLIR